jgi:hypothetical protein
VKRANNVVEWASVIVMEVTVHTNHRASDFNNENIRHVLTNVFQKLDRLCGLVVRVLGYRSGGPGSIPGTTRKKKVVGLERGPLSLASTTEELLDRKVAAPV